MTSTGIITILLILANIAFSYRGLRNSNFFNGYKFEVDQILVKKDYIRLITSGFLHVSWGHLILNLITLYLFSGSVEAVFGPGKFLLLYFISLIGGNLFTLFIHRHHGNYSAVGASGAVAGIVFAAIAVFPGMDVSFFGLPVYISAWLYGVIYIAFSVYGIRSQKDNVGHEAHLGGALIGMTTALILQPGAFAENYKTILVIMVPTIVFIYFVITKPQILLVDNLFFKKNNDQYSPGHAYNQQRTDKQKELDKLLEKISRSGMESLTRKEKEKLKEYSQM